MKKMWLKGAEDNTDLYVAFCGKFYCSAEQELPFVISGCSWFRIFLNGMFLTEGPYRYDDAHPVSETISRPVRRGENIIFCNRTQRRRSNQDADEYGSFFFV